MRELNRYQGLTLLEVVIVIVILGILAAVAIPRFIELQSNSIQGAVNEVAASMGSVSALNDAGCSATGQVVTANKCMRVEKCSDAAITVVPPIHLAAPGAPVMNQYNLAVDTRVTKNGTEATCILQFSKDGMTYTKAYIVTGAGH